MSTNNKNNGHDRAKKFMEKLKPFHDNQSTFVAHWSRAPGVFLDSETGEEIWDKKFIGTIQTWYATLTEVLLKTIHNFENKTECHSHDVMLFCGDEVSTILMFTPEFSPKNVQFPKRDLNSNQYIGDVLVKPLYANVRIPSNRIDIVLIENSVGKLTDDSQIKDMVSVKIHNMGLLDS